MSSRWPLTLARFPSARWLSGIDGQRGYMRMAPSSLIVSPLGTASDGLPISCLLQSPSWTLAIPHPRSARRPPISIVKLRVGQRRVGKRPAAEWGLAGR